MFSKYFLLFQDYLVEKQKFILPSHEKQKKNGS